MSCLLSLLVASVLCGELVPLEDKVFSSTKVIEFTFSYDGKKRLAETARIVVPSEGDVVPMQLSFTEGSPCVALARKTKKPVKVLAFFDANGKQLVGVEQDRGEGTDFDPGYAALVEAVAQAKSWKDERMRPIERDALWLRPKAALTSSNPYLRRLAAHFLKRHEAEDLVDAAWGAVGTAERKKNEPIPTAPNPCAR